MSRITAPVTRLARSLNSATNITSGTAAAAVNNATRSSPLLDSTAHSHHAVAGLAPKYADLLLGRGVEHADSSRGLTTAHRPSPQPSLSSRARPLMQTFSQRQASSSAATTLLAETAGHVDAIVIPPFDPVIADEFASNVPILPDNDSSSNGASGATVDTPVQLPEISIIAAHPDKVLSATPLGEVEGIGLDGVELRFAHEGEQSQSSEEDERSSGMIRDIWKGMLDDVFGAAKRVA